MKALTRTEAVLLRVLIDRDDHGFNIGRDEPTDDERAAGDTLVAAGRARFRPCNCRFGCGGRQIEATALGREALRVYDAARSILAIDT